MQILTGSGSTTYPLQGFGSVMNVYVVLPTLFPSLHEAASSVVVLDFES